MNHIIRYVNRIIPRGEDNHVRMFSELGEDNRFLQQIMSLQPCQKRNHNYLLI